MGNGTFSAKIRAISITCLNAAIGAIITLIITASWNYFTSGNFTPFLKKHYNGVIIGKSIKGYVPKDGIPYYDILVKKRARYVDINLNFFDDKFYKNVGYIFIRIIPKSGQKASTTEVFYSVRSDNHFRISKNFSRGVYDVLIGFVFAKDIDNDYPEVYCCKNIEITAGY